MIDITTISYAAGLVDGEGTITFSRSTIREQRTPVISISSTTYELIDFMKQTFGGNIITLRRKVKAHHKDAWHWYAKRHKALEIMELLVPYLREPSKKRRAEFLLAGYNNIVVANGKYTTDQLKIREDFSNQFFTL